MHYMLCKESHWTKTLQKELIADFSKSNQTVGELPLIKIPCDVDLKDKYIAFSTTCLPNAFEITADSISQQTKKISENFIDQIPNNIKINFHVFGLTDKYGVLETGRAEIIKEKIFSVLKKKKINCQSKQFDRSCGFLQILILADRSMAISFITANEMDNYRSVISPFVGGFNNVADDKHAPSRAFKKIVEAQAILGEAILPNETLVDLGACPGGWSYIARKNGAHVIAIDRSPLDANLMDDSKVKFIKTDAFKYKATENVDWVVSDIICAPERILELINYWVLGKNCRRFIFTIKFQGQRDYGVLKKFKKIAAECEFRVVLKQLNANKNEVTIMGAM